MTDREWMERAVAAARRALGTTAPNPAVGAVLVQDDRLLGEGWTQPVGGPHAEWMALAAAREGGFDPRGATMYVTLEPCRHHGRTPPCTDAIVAAGIARVVVGVRDAFPAMRGQSLADLAGAGIAVEEGVCATDCARLVRGFTRAITVGLPEVTCKAAISVDGALAAATGDSQWITGPEARAHGHGLRATHDAILVGIETVLADDPRLTCRTGGTHPRPVVLDTELRTPSSARVLAHPLRPLLLAAEEAPDRDLGSAEIVRLPRSRSGLDIEAALKAMAARDLHRVLVEGGARVHRSLLDSGLVDTLHLYVGAVAVPGGKTWLGGPAVSSLRDGIRLPAPEVTRLGQDVLLTYELPHRLGV